MLMYILLGVITTSAPPETPTNIAVLSLSDFKLVGRTLDLSSSERLLVLTGGVT